MAAAAAVLPVSEGVVGGHGVDPARLLEQQQQVARRAAVAAGDLGGVEYGGVVGIRENDVFEGRDVGHGDSAATRTRVRIGSHRTLARVQDCAVFSGVKHCPQLVGGG